MSARAMIRPICGQSLSTYAARSTWRGDRSRPRRKQKTVIWLPAGYAKAFEPFAKQGSNRRVGGVEVGLQPRASVVRGRTARNCGAHSGWSVCSDRCARNIVLNSLSSRRSAAKSDGLMPWVAEMDFARGVSGFASGKFWFSSGKCRPYLTASSINTSFARRFVIQGRSHRRGKSSAS